MPSDQVSTAEAQAKFVRVMGRAKQAWADYFSELSGSVVTSPRGVTDDILGKTWYFSGPRAVVTLRLARSWNNMDVASGMVIVVLEGEKRGDGRLVAERPPWVVDPDAARDPRRVITATWARKFQERFTASTHDEEQTVQTALASMQAVAATVEAQVLAVRQAGKKAESLADLVVLLRAVQNVEASSLGSSARSLESAIKELGRRAFGRDAWESAID